MRALLESRIDFRVAGEAGDQDAVIALAKATTPDVILLHMGFNDDGFALALLHDLKEAELSAKVVMVSEVDDKARLVRAVALGVMGVVMKDQAPEVLEKAIRKVHEGEVWLERSLTAEALRRIASPERSGVFNRDAAKAIWMLSKRERDVISAVCQGLQNEVIGQMLAISEATVRHHLTSIYNKLEMKNRVELVKYAMTHGLANPH